MAKGAARRAHGEVQRAKIKSQKAEVASSEMLLNQVLHPDKKRMVPLVKTIPSRSADAGSIRPVKLVGDVFNTCI